MALGHAKAVGISNILNTHASMGIGPLDLEDIHTRLVTNLLFSDGLTVSSTSLLCNPFTHHCLECKRDFFEWLLASGRILTTFYDDTGSFCDLFDKLRKNRSAGLQIQNQNIIKQVAKVLDKIFPKSNVVSIDGKRFANERTTVSTEIIENLPAVHPALFQFHKKIRQLAVEELNKRGEISGTWWINLGKTASRRLSAFDSIFSEVGEFVYDYSLSRMTNHLLVRHPYGLNTSQLIDLTGPTEGEIQIRIDQGILDERDIDAVVFDQDLLKNLDFDDLNLLLVENNKPHRQYSDALMALLKNKTEGNLLKAKHKLDIYLDSLSDVIRSTKISKYINEKKQLNRLRSMLGLWTAVDNIWIGLVVAVPAITALTGLQHGYSGLTVIVGIGALLSFPKKEYQRKISEIMHKVESYESKLPETRPVNIIMKT